LFSFRYCTNNGEIQCNDGGGLFGAYSFYVRPNSTNTITNCINTGNIIDGYGLFGVNAFYGSAAIINIMNCANTGIISVQNRNGANAIIGSGILQNCNISNCYTLSGVFSNTPYFFNTVITNIYEPSTNWSTNTAISILVNPYPGIWAYYKDPNTGITIKNIPFVLSSLNPTNEVVTTITALTSDIPLFNEGTKILCYLNENEEYIFVEDLGNLINNQNRIVLIGFNGIVNSIIYNYELMDQLYRCSEANYPQTFENLIRTGFDNIQINIAYYTFF
jgi:hypothetical protein